VSTWGLCGHVRIFSSYDVHSSTMASFRIGPVSVTFARNLTSAFLVATHTLCLRASYSVERRGTRNASVVRGVESSMGPSLPEYVSARDVRSGLLIPPSWKPPCWATKRFAVSIRLHTSPAGMISLFFPLVRKFLGSSSIQACFLYTPSSSAFNTGLWHNGQHS
jgi:hypothetical protein